MLLLLDLRVMAAQLGDHSPDRGQVRLGGPNRFRRQTAHRGVSGGGVLVDLEAEYQEALRLFGR